MWYVLQTRTGYESTLKEQLESRIDSGLCTRLFVPMFEDVRRKDGKSRIAFRRLFPGYLFIETTHPEELLGSIRSVREYVRILGAPEQDGEKTYVPVSAEDQAFLETLLADGVMHVSFVKQVKNGRIGQVIGPLAGYANHITRLEFRHRMAIVDAEIFGKQRKIKFGLWTDADDPIPWIEEKLKQQKGIQEENRFYIDQVDIGLHPGDRVMDTSGLYGNEVFVIESVNPYKRTIRTKTRIFNSLIDIELFADQVEKLEDHTQQSGHEAHLP